jgi:hypothetical protein
VSVVLHPSGFDPDFAGFAPQKHPFVRIQWNRATFSETRRRLLNESIKL